MSKLVDLFKSGGRQNGSVDSFKASNPGPADDFWYGPAAIGRPTMANTRVDHISALRSDLVYAGLKLLADTVAMVPLFVFRREGDDGKSKAPDHPLYDVLKKRPNSWQTAFEFRQTMTLHLVGKGRAYAEIRPGRRGAVDELWPMHPARVRVEQRSDRSLVYHYTEPTGTVRTLLQDEVFHLHGLSEDGVDGIDPIMGPWRETVGLALGEQDYASRFYANYGKPPGFFEHPEFFESKKERQRWLDDMAEQTSGPNRHKTPILEQGIKYNELKETNRDGQFVESRKMTSVAVARLIGVPPHKLGILDRATFSNIEQQAIDYVVSAAMPLFVNIEQAIERDLIFERPWLRNQEEIFAEFQLAALLRGDVKSRYQAYRMAIQDGWMNRNEVRARENMNPGPPELDEFLEPQNMRPAGSMDEGADDRPPAGEDDERDDEPDDDDNVLLLSELNR